MITNAGLPPKVAAATGASAKGQKQTHASQQTALLFDDIVGAGEQSGRDGDAERLGSFKTDNEFEFFRLLDW